MLQGRDFGFSVVAGEDSSAVGLHPTCLCQCDGKTHVSSTASYISNVLNYITASLAVSSPLCILELRRPTGVEKGSQKHKYNCNLDFCLTVYHQLGKVIQINQLDSTMFY